MWKKLWEWLHGAGPPVKASHLACCNGGCGRDWRCVACRQFFGACARAPDDDWPDLCDGCWLRAEDARRFAEAHQEITW